MPEKEKPTLNVDNIDEIYMNMSKALNIFVQRYELKFEEIFIILRRLRAEWDRKTMDMYFAYLTTHKEDKPFNDSSYVK